MTVAAILSGKGRDVATTTAAKSIAEAAAVLARRKIGALVVVENGDRIVGIISERDIVRMIANKGAAALAEPVSAVMTRGVVTCGDSETIDSVMERMTRGRFRHLPVVVEGRLNGIVSIGDVVKARIGQVEREAEEMRAYIATA
jgi:CBS domain-containing protein